MDWCDSDFVTFFCESTRAMISGLSNVSPRAAARMVSIYAACRDLLRHHCAAHGVAVRNRVLMPNHAHLILVSAFLDRVSNLFGRNPKPGKRGPKRRQEGELSALSP